MKEEKEREGEKARKFESIMRATYDAVAGSSRPIQTCNVRLVSPHTQINTEIHCFSLALT